MALWHSLSQLHVSRSHELAEHVPSARCPWPFSSFLDVEAVFGPCWNYEDGRHTRRTASQQCGILIKLQNHYTNPRWLIFGFLLLWKEQTVILVKPLWLLAFCYLWSDVGRGTHILPAICISQYVWCFMCSWFNFKSSTTSITFVVTKYQQFCIYPEWVPFVVVVDKMSW